MIVIDDFLSDYKQRRAQALSGQFAPHDAPGGSFPGINTQAVNDFPYARVQTFYRLTLTDDALPTFIHNDCAMARTTGVLFLSEGTGGTAFWTHKASGSTGAHELDLPIERYHADSFDERNWRLRRVVAWQPNRLVLFPSELWHSPYPRNGWGASPETGRLIQVYFFS